MALHFIVAAHVRRMGKVIVLVCLSLHTLGGTYLGQGSTHLGPGGVPTLAGGTYLGQGGSYLGRGVPTLAGGTYLGWGVPKIGYPPPNQGSVPPGQVRYSICGGRYASCVHAGRLSCYNLLSKVLYAI